VAQSVANGVGAGEAPDADWAQLSVTSTVPPPARVSVTVLGRESCVLTLYDAMIRPPLAGVTVAGVPGTMPVPKSRGTMPLSVTADCTLAVTPMGAVEVCAEADDAAARSMRASAERRFTREVPRSGSGVTEMPDGTVPDLHHEDRRARQKIQNFRRCLRTVRNHDIIFMIGS